MKAVGIILVLVGFVQSLPHKSLLEAEWNTFKLDYDKYYNDANEEQLRWQIFRDNMEIIDRHNERYEAGEETFQMGVNQFTDLLSEEFEALVLGNMNSTEETEEIEEELDYDPLEDVKLPAKVDWRQHGAVTRVKNQGHCGSCWAFAAVGTLEGQQYRKTRKLVELSEKNLLDCSGGRFNNHGCHGGLATKALKYIQYNHGIDTESSYPYEPHADRCQFNRVHVGATVKEIKRVRSGSERALARAVAEVGPIAVSLEATHFHHYKSGVLSKACHKQSNHAVLVVGYGHDRRGGDYWLVKNSWGKRFGEDGYIRMARNRGNMCFIANRGVYPVV